jgi:hypothetical protein
MDLEYLTVLDISIFLKRTKGSRRKLSTNADVLDGLGTVQSTYTTNNNKKIYVHFPVRGKYFLISPFSFSLPILNSRNQMTDLLLIFWWRGCPKKYEAHSPKIFKKKKNKNKPKSTKTSVSVSSIGHHPFPVCHQSAQKNLKKNKIWWGKK